MSTYQQIFENNRQWVAEKTGSNKNFFSDMAKGQSPEVLYIGCADSRVPASQVMGLGPGDAFVHRNVANLVPNTDHNVHAVIEYAVAHLGVKHVVVCGHYGCGGVQAAMQSSDLGNLNSWLREIRDVYRLHQDELDGISDESARYQRLVELNVHEQCTNVLKLPVVQKKLQEKKLSVHGWVYSLADGLLKDLEIPVEQIQNKIGAIYQVG